MPYTSIESIHNPATGTAAPATWGDQIHTNLEFLVDPPACSIYHSTTQSLADTTPTPLSANSENFDNDSMHSTVTNNSRVTIVTAGRYLLFSTVQYATSTGYRATSFLVNGTTTYQLSAIPAVSGAVTRITGSRTLVLAAGDYVQAQGYQNSGGALNAQLDEFAVYFMTR